MFYSFVTIASSRYLFTVCFNDLVVALRRHGAWLSYLYE